jgi:hypothetical protein
LALVAANVYNSVAIAMHWTSQTAPSYIGTQVEVPKSGATNPKVEDGQYGDMWVTEKQPVVETWATEISDKKDKQPIAFPPTW